MSNLLNTSRYIELLKKDLDLKNTNSSLRFINPKEDDELSSYQLALENQCRYNRKQDYISLIKKYLMNEFSSFGFVVQFSSIERETLKKTEILETNLDQLNKISIDSQAGEFSLMIENIVSLCEAYTSDFYSCEEEDPDSKFRAYLEEISLKMEEYLGQ